ncbi:MAG: SpoIVB peptidase [Eubacteriales bacterium]
MNYKYNKRLKIYRTILVLVLASVIVGVGYYQYYDYYKQVPDKISVNLGNEHQIDVNVPAKATIYNKSLEVGGFGSSNIPAESIEIDLSNTMQIIANEESSYEMEVKLFGFIPLKTVELEVVTGVQLIPGGIPVGIYVKTNGVLVIGTGTFTGADGKQYEPSKNILKSGDYIQAINGIEVMTKNQIITELQKSQGEEVILTFTRLDENMEVTLFPILSDSGDYKVGIWLRDSAQGIGTMTFLTEDGVFGALGHGITDIDTTTLMNMKGGSLYQTTIVAIHKGEKGIPGELTGSIDYLSENIMGDIIGNTEKGIYGIVNVNTSEMIGNDTIPMGYASEVVIGDAEILCTITGEENYYDIVIRKVDYSDYNSNRSIEIEIVDETLLHLTGGIVQGMSGAPIVQNGKLIGAVTHVLVNDPTRGYGIFIENMLETAEGVKY